MNVSNIIRLVSWLPLVHEKVCVFRVGRIDVRNRIKDRCRTLRERDLDIYVFMLIIPNLIYVVFYEFRIGGPGQ